MRRLVYVFIFVVALAAGLTLAQTGAQKAPQPTQPVLSPSQEMLRQYNSINKRLVDMAEDFPEDKYGFKAQKDQRSFGENLLHVAEENYRLLTAIKGTPMGPAGGKELKSSDFKTKADIVKLMKQMTADGAALLQEQGDAGLSREIKYPYGNRMVHASFAWIDIVEHSAEHYGQLVVYYRVNDMVPPASRPHKQS
jgi:uncharacterized damage-inducible protein DinB